MPASSQEQEEPKSSESEQNEEEKPKDTDTTVDPNEVPKHENYHVEWVHKSLENRRNPSYYDCFYGKEGQINTLMQKYKTKLCRHFKLNGYCPLK